MKPRKRRLWLLIVPLVFAVGGGSTFLYWMWECSPPLWWVLRGSHVKKVVVHWDKRKIEIVDAQQVQEFYQAVFSGSSPLPYATRCLPDRHPENWSVTFIRSGQQPFQVQVGTDTCGTFYVPDVGSTYFSGQLMTLIKKRIEVV